MSRVIVIFFPADIMKSGSKQILSTPTGILYFMAFLISPLCILSHFSHARLCVTLWTVTCQAPLSMEFSRQEYWNGLPCLSPGDLPDPGIEPASLTSPALAGRFFNTYTTWEILLSFFLAIYLL